MLGCAATLASLTLMTEIEMSENLPSRTIRNIPSELSGTVPRGVRLAGRSRSMPIVLALLIGGTVVSWSLYGKHAVNQVQQRSVLHNEGIETQAEITSLKRAGKGPYVVKYTFVANGQNISGLADVPPEPLRSLPESGPIAVRYLPSNPAINHPTAWEWSLSSEWFLIFVLTTLSVLCGVTIAGAPRDRRLLVWGTPVTGIVSRCTPTKSAYSVQYEFRTQSAELVKGSGESLVRREGGECIWILYLPKDPRRNRPYPLSDFCVKE